MPRIPLQTGLDGRIVAGRPDIGPLNRYFEQDPRNQDSQTALVRRPRTRTLLGFPGRVTRIFTASSVFGGDLFVVSGGVVYRWNGQDPPVALFSTEVTEVISPAITYTSAISSSRASAGTQSSPQPNEAYRYLWMTSGGSLHAYTDIPALWRTNSMQAQQAVTGTRASNTITFADTNRNIVFPLLAPTRTYPFEECVHRIISPVPERNYYDGSSVPDIEIYVEDRYAPTRATYRRGTGITDLQRTDAFEIAGKWYRFCVTGQVVVNAFYYSIQHRASSGRTLSLGAAAFLDNGDDTGTQDNPYIVVCGTSDVSMQRPWAESLTYTQTLVSFKQCVLALTERVNETHDLVEAIFTDNGADGFTLEIRARAVGVDANLYVVPTLSLAGVHDGDVSYAMRTRTIVPRETFADEPSYRWLHLSYTRFRDIFSLDTDATTSGMWASGGNLLAGGVNPGETQPQYDASSRVTWTNGWARIVLPDNRRAGEIAEVSSFLVVAVEGTDRMYFLRPGAIVIENLDFFSAESSGDEIVALRSISDRLFVFGRSTIEIWYATGDTEGVTFLRVAGQVIPYGAIEGSVSRVRDGLMFVGNDENVYFMQYEGVLQRVSSPAITERIRVSR